MRGEFDKKIKEYIKDNFAHEDSALKLVGADLPDIEKRMQMDADEAKILQVIVRMANAKKIVEIGTLNGYSAIWMARALPDDGRLFAFEKSSKRVEPCIEAFKNCGVSDKIDLLQGEALENLKDIEHHGPFDMVFIDADKGNYCNYLDWAEANVRKGGIIIGDNSFLFGAVYGEPSRDNIKPQTTQIMQEFNKRLGDSEKYTGILLPTAEGLTIAVKEF